MVKYSVIIPVYNAEKTLERCLNSLLSQNREDTEIIVINDGSTDQSGEILNVYKENYNCLKVIDEANSGVSIARNAGIECASGDYILFVDSDDYVANDYFSEMDSWGNEDLYVFSRLNIGTEKTDSSFFESIDKRLTFDKKLEILTAGRKMLPPWNKRFKRNIIQEHQVRFVEDFSIGEDFDFSMNYVTFCTSIQISSKAIYYLDDSHNNSLSRKYRPLLNEKLKAVYSHIEDLMVVQRNTCENQKKLLSIIDYLYVRNVFTCISEELKNERGDYFRNKEKFRLICDGFQNKIGNTTNCVNFEHRIIRWLVKNELILCIYMIVKLLKWK